MVVDEYLYHQKKFLEIDTFDWVYNHYLSENYSRLRQFQIRVGMSKMDPSIGKSTNALCYAQVVAMQPITDLFWCAEVIVGRYVTVQLNYRGYLSLCEVEVFPICKDMFITIMSHISFYTTENSFSFYYRSVSGKSCG